MADLYFIIHVQLDRELPIVQLDEFVYQMFSLDIFKDGNPEKVNSQPVRYDIPDPDAIEFLKNQLHNQYHIGTCKAINLEDDHRAYLDADFYTQDYVNASIFNVGPSNTWGRSLISEHNEVISQYLKSEFSNYDIQVDVVYTIDAMGDTPDIFEQLEQQKKIRGLVYRL